MTGFSICIPPDHTFLLPEDLDEDRVPCCWSSMQDGPSACSCWEPVYDLPQSTPHTHVEPETRRKACPDCAFRKGSPERERGDELEGLPNFWCHQGIRRPVAWRHPDGRVRPVPDAVNSPDYQPPLVDGVPYKADGRPADRCAGHAATRLP